MRHRTNEQVPGSRLRANPWERIEHQQWRVPIQEKDQQVKQGRMERNSSETRQGKTTLRSITQDRQWTRDVPFGIPRMRREQSISLFMWRQKENSWTDSCTAGKETSTRVGHLARGTKNEPSTLVVLSARWSSNLYTYPIIECGRSREDEESYFGLYLKFCVK